MQVLIFGETSIYLEFSMPYHSSKNVFASTNLRSVFPR